MKAACVAFLLLMSTIESMSSSLAATVALLEGAGGNYRVPVRSLADLRYQGVVRQQYDFSCGSAAVATLLSHHYDDATDEATVFSSMYESGDKGRIRKEGFSLLDMKLYLESEGYRADGFRLSLQQFARLGVPGIVLLDANGYLHFVVIKGIADDEVLVGDPAVGVRVIAKADFARQWRGVVLLIRNRADVARKHYNRPLDWAARREAPVKQGVLRASVADFTLRLPSRSDF